MEGTGKSKVGLIGITVGLVVALVAGFLWFFSLGTNSPVGAGWYLFSFAAGLTMIVLPCTLPLAFVIVPLSMGKGPVKGFGIALAFGLGVALTLSTYGILAAVLGKVAIGTLGAPLEVVKNWLYFIAGTLAYLFALGELGFIKFRMPTYGGAAPAFIQKQKDIVKALCLGLFLGNLGVGCPHPATPVILTRIAVSGDVFYGWLLFFVHAFGRIVPLLILALLGIMGVNALTWLVSRKEKLERATGWGMVIVSGFIIVLGLFSHDWWVFSGQHTLLEEYTQEERFLGLIIDRLNLAGVPHAHGVPSGSGLFGLPLSLGNFVLVALWVLPLWWALLKKQKTIETLPDEEKKIEKRIAPLWISILTIATILLAVVVMYVLPDRFYSRAMLSMHDESAVELMDKEEHTAIPDDHMGDGHESEYHEEANVTSGIVVDMNTSPSVLQSGLPVRFDFFVNVRPSRTAVVDLELNHEKLIHVIGVRSDMNEFFHIHPEASGSPGTFSLSNIFGKPGTYKVWSEVTSEGVTHAFGHPQLNVAGSGPTNEKNVTFSRSVVADTFQVVLDADLPLVKERESTLSFDVHDKDGAEVELENFLGVPMHLAIIKDNFSIFQHVHPEEDMMNGHSVVPFIEKVRAHTDEPQSGLGDETVNFHVTLPQAGVYRAYAQFRPKGTTLPADQAVLASFWLSVEEKTPAGVPPRVILLVVSILLIAILSWATKKYITVNKTPVKSIEAQ